MNRFVKGMVVIIMLSTFLTGCTQNTALTDQMASLKSQPQLLSLLPNAVAVLELLEAKDFEGLSTYIDDTKGVRFSPYSYIDIANDKVFTKAQIASIAQDSEKYTWGSYDGSGFPITLDFNDYYHKFVYDKAFITPDQIGYKKSFSQGNSIDNLSEVYPEANFVEFYSSGVDPSGLDWASLKLVFENVQGNWVLVGIVHAQWTI